MIFDLTILNDYWILLFEGALLTLKITVFGFLIGYPSAIALALLGLAPGWIPAIVSRLYIEFFRNVPFLIILFLSFYTLPFIGVRLPAELVGTVALGLYISAYYSEVIRAAVLALPKGQYESARVIGMSPGQAMWNVVVPQIFRSLIPPTTSLTLLMLKETAVLSAITVPELSYQSLVVQGATFAPFEVFFAVAIIYWAASITLSQLARYFENRIGRTQRDEAHASPIAERYLSLNTRKARRASC